MLPCQKWHYPLKYLEQTHWNSYYYAVSIFSSFLKHFQDKFGRMLSAVPIELTKSWNQFWGSILFSCTFVFTRYFFNLNSIRVLFFHKVQIFWEGHKFENNLPLIIWRYSVASNVKWKISSNFVAFSEYLNFTKISQQFKAIVGDCTTAWTMFTC